MQMITRALLLVATAGLAACSTSADRFGGDAAGQAGAGAYGAAGSGGIDDPRSAAYFQNRVGDRVLFVVDTSTLTPEAQQTLRGQAQFLTANPEYSAVVEGHADERGTRDYNLALSARRAASVMDYLVSQGVSRSRLRPLAFGKERPLEVCSVEACYTQNRRAVTVLGTGAALTG